MTTPILARSRSARAACLVAVALIVCSTPTGAAPASREQSARTPCEEPPLTMHLEAAGDPPVGSERFAVTDAVARRVSIVLDAKTTSNPKILERQRKEAVETPLALYTLYIADFRIPRRELEGFSFGVIRPTRTGTIGTLTVVPPKKRGLRAGDVVRDQDIQYETTTTFAALGLTVVSRASDDLRAYTDVQVRVRLVELDENSICIDVDVEFTNGGEVVVAARGAVEAPVIRADEDFYFT